MPTLWLTLYLAKAQPRAWPLTKPIVMADLRVLGVRADSRKVNGEDRHSYYTSYHHACHAGTLCHLVQRHELRLEPKNDAPSSPQGTKSRPDTYANNIEKL
ncbi:hypothetical protein VNO77_03026 [Canavalia gladiata]|uniref:Uncharacterized protein n=1 Tax=Canavalia gladiata TaxID=3824 RepID=A0AAN9MZ01_CANGL